MFAFEIWGQFASFRDPFTISQNISLPIPPKTTVAGMMASVLGVENYFEDKAFSDFEYSVITVNSIRKKSFSQNYINDYTSKVQTQITNLNKEDYKKIALGFRDKKNPQKPINRELLLNPRYLIVIKDFKYEDKISKYLRDRMSKFSFYLGNSEFAGNFKFIEIIKSEEIKLEEVAVNSFILESDVNHIDFKEGIRYSTLSFATALNVNRTPISSTSVIIGSETISVKNLKVYCIESIDKKYYCRFV